MRKISASIIILLVLASISGVVFIATWEIPAPIAQIEKVLPDDRFPH